MLFNIINPSDPYTMRGADLEIAAIAVALLGEGQYGLEEIGGDRSGVVPLFVLGGHDAWFTKQFGRDFSATLDHVLIHRGEELGKTLMSVFIGTPADKLTFDEKAAQCPDDEAYAELLLSTHDGKRTSDNDIGRRAWNLARGIHQAAQLRAEAINMAAVEAGSATIQ